MLRHTIDFGKIDYYGIGENVNPVEVQIDLYRKDGKPVFTAQAAVYDQAETDYLMGGQCLDYIAQYLYDNEQYMEIYRLWRKYHLNDMHAGTPEQEEALNKAGIKGYEKACEYLKGIGLYEVEYNGKPYRYGSRWLYHEIPEDDLKKIEALFLFS